MLDFILPMPKANVYGADTIYNLALLDAEAHIIVATDEAHSVLHEVEREIDKVTVLNVGPDASVGALLSAAFARSSADYAFLIEPGYHINSEVFGDFTTNLLGPDDVNSLYICDGLDQSTNKKIYNFDRVHIDLRELMLLSYVSMFSPSGYVVNRHRLTPNMMAALSHRAENNYPHIGLRNQFIMNGHHIVFAKEAVVQKSSLIEKCELSSRPYSERPLEAIQQIAQEYYFLDQSLHQDLKVFSAPERVFSSLHVANHYRTKTAPYVQQLKPYQASKLDSLLEKAQSHARASGFFSGGLIARSYGRIAQFDDAAFSSFYDDVLTEQNIRVV